MPWIQDYLPGMEFLAEDCPPDIEPASCPGCEYPDMEHV